MSLTVHFEEGCTVFRRALKGTEENKQYLLRIKHGVSIKNSEIMFMRISVLPERLPSGLHSQME